MVVFNDGNRNEENTSDEEWENPKPRKGERKRLEQLLREINAVSNSEQIKEEYRAISKNLFRRYQELYNRPELTELDIQKLSYQLLEDACIGNILLTEGNPEEQIREYRRLEIIYDRLEEMDIDPARIFRRELVLYLKGNKK